MQQHDAITRMAIEKATSMTLIDLSQEELYPAYLTISECVNNDATDDLDEKFSILSCYEGFLDWNDLLQIIDEEVEKNRNMLLQVLALAKDGIVQAAENDQLDLDMTQLSMTSMVELGATEK